MLVWSQIGEEFNMGKNVVVKAFKTYHVVPSQVMLYCSLPLYLGMAIVCPCCGTTHHKIGTSLGHTGFDWNWSFCTWSYLQPHGLISFLHLRKVSDLFTCLYFVNICKYLQILTGFKWSDCVLPGYIFAGLHIVLSERKTETRVHGAARWQDQITKSIWCHGNTAWNLTTTLWCQSELPVFMVALKFNRSSFPVFVNGAVLLHLLGIVDIVVLFAYPILGPCFSSASCSVRQNLH